LTKQKMTFAVDNIEIVENEIDNTQFARLKVDAFSTEPSAHDTFVTEETLKRTAKTILLKPFVFAIDERFDDLGTHSSKEIAGGFVPHNSPISFSTRPNGTLMMKVEVLVWKRYSGKLLEYFERDGGRKGVSVEIEIFNSKEDPATGLTEIIDFCYNAITALGDLIRSAIPDAEAVLQFAKDFENAKQEYFSKYEDVDFTIPQNVKKSVQKALDGYKEKGGKISSAILANARFIAKNEKITPERIRQIFRFINRHSDYDELTAGLLGGKQAGKWSADIIKQINEIDDRRLSYFDFSKEDTDNSEKETSVQDNYLGMEEMNMAKEKVENFAETGVEKPAEEKMAADTSVEEKVEGAEEEPNEEMAAGATDEKKFSLDGYVDVVAALAFLENTTDVNDAMAEKMRVAADEMKKDGEKNFGAIMAGMYAGMCHAKEKMEQMAADSKVYMAENEELKKFKTDVENEKKQFAVNGFLVELAEKVVVPEESMTAMREKATDFTFAEIDGWKNHCKAFAFDFTPKLGNENEEEDNILKYALPFRDQITVTDSVWDELK